MTDNSLLQDFITETGEHLEETERNLLRLEQQPGDEEVLNDIFRSVHTIKGSSEYLGMERIAELSHKLESLLDQLRRGELSIDSDVIDLLMSGNDRIGTLVSELDQHQVEQSSIDDLLSRLSAKVSPAEPDHTQSDDDADMADTYLDDEYDEELFGIFAEQLKEGLRGLVQENALILAGQGISSALENSVDQLATLRSSANYMGYDDLKGRYEKWEQSLNTALEKVRKDEAFDADTFSRDVMIANITQIQALFPKVPGLDAILESTETAAPSTADLEADIEPQAERQEISAVEAFSESTDQGLLKDFITETGEHLEDTERNLLRLEQEPGNADVLNDIFRSIHTIKGSSEYLGMERIADLSHKLESLLDQLRKGECSIDGDVIDLLISGNDRIGTLVGELDEHQAEQSTIDDLLSRVSDMTSKAKADGGEITDPEGTIEADFDDEYDEELFAIFSEQLIESLEGLVQDAAQLKSDQDIGAALESSTERLSTLRSSANYMGYDDLKNLYSQWDKDIKEAAGKVNSGSAFDPEVFSQEVMVANIEQIQALFPKISGLASILEPVDTPPVPAAEAEPGVADPPEPEQAVADQSVEEALSETADQGLLADFIAETGEHLEETERNLLRLEQQPGDAEVLNEIFRSIHTIKGSSEYLGMERMAELSHKLESLLDLLRNGERSIDNDVIDLLIDTSDRVGVLMEEIEQQDGEKSTTDDLIARLDAILQQTTDDQPDDHRAALEAEADEAGIPYSEAYDQELFGIFMDQLNAGLKVLSAETERIKDATDIVSCLETCGKQLATLRSSANYMEYDDLKTLYEQWIARIEDVMTKASDDGAVDTTMLVDDVMNANIEKVRRYFQNIDPDSPQVSVDAAVGISEGEDVGSPDAPGDDKVHLDIDSISIDDLGGDMALEPPDSASDADDPLLERLANAFDANLGISDLVKPSAYPEDIESDLLSGDEGEAQPTPEEIIQEPSDDIAEYGIDTELADVESMLFSGGKPSKARVKRPVLEPPTVSVPRPGAAPSTASESPEPRGGFSMGRRQSDKFRERMQKQSIRVDAAKIDSLMNQVGELVVSRSGFNQLFADMRELQLVLKQSQKLESQEMLQIKEITNRISEATVSLGRVTSELQENVMKVRMLPIAQLFSRYPRLVHDLVRNTDKKVNLEIQGEETELDKMVIEQLADPLIHIIRNAVDHGLESEGDRRQKGKPETGSLRLEAYHESNYVVIDISDDGCGIDASHVKAQALEKGYVAEDEAQEMSEDELIALIMRPGFSTAGEITTTSGRGVGMDVVKDKVEKLNGTIDISTTVGAGARFRIKIPLTLAIIPALLVRVRNEVFTIPLATVDETLLVRREDLSTIEGLEVYYLRDNTVPLIRLDRVFNMPGAATDREELFVVVVNTGAKQVGFVVDELKGRQEVVIKPLEDYLQEKSGFSGATILGDGSISLILDVFELIHLSLDQHASNIKAVTA